MKTMLVFVAMTIAIVAGSVVANAQSPADAQSAFRFDLAQANGPRGAGVEGYVYNGLPWRITNVRLNVESVDGDGTVTASSSGWVVGDVGAGGRGYFFVLVSSPAKTYRATVQSFDKVTRETFESP
jgi:hypothetical protein